MVRVCVIGLGPIGNRHANIYAEDELADAEIDSLARPNHPIVQLDLEGDDKAWFLGRAGDKPVVGDWNGDGLDTIGVRRASTGQMYLRNSNSAGAADMKSGIGPEDAGVGSTEGQLPSASEIFPGMSASQNPTTVFVTFR